MEQNHGIDYTEQERLERELEERIASEKEKRVELDATSESFKRRQYILAENMELARNRHCQLISRPYVYSYLYYVTQETWELPISWQKRPRRNIGNSRSGSTSRRSGTGSMR